MHCAVMASIKYRIIDSTNKLIYLYLEKTIWKKDYDNADMKTNLILSSKHLKQELTINMTHQWHNGEF